MANDNTPPNQNELEQARLESEEYEVVEVAHTRLDYCHNCNDFVETTLVDICVSLIEETSKLTSEEDIYMDIVSKSKRTVTKCLSCSGYDTTINDMSFQTALLKNFTPK
jgi:hypothetical protein